MASWLVELLNQKQRTQPRKKTAVIPSRRYDPLGRRRLSKDIRVFDMGFLASGVTMDYADPFRDDPLVDDSYAEIFDIPVRPVSLEHYAALENLIFQTPVSQWADAFHQIDEVYTTPAGLADPYVVNWRGTSYVLRSDEAGFEDYFVNNRLRPNVDPVNGNIIVSSPNHRYFNSINLSTNKITRTRDFLADPVTDFVPSRNFDIFLFPSLVRIGIITLLTETIAGVHTHISGVFGFHFVVWPREDGLDSSWPYFNLMVYATDPTVSQFGALWATSETASAQDEYFLSTKACVWMQNEQAHFAREYVKDIDTGSFTFSNIDPSAIYPTSDFPSYPTLPTSPAAANFGFGVSTDVSPLAGKLLAVLRQGGIDYYIWQT